MSKLWKHLESHHGQYGVALFIGPVLVVAMGVVSVMCALSLVFGH